MDREGGRENEFETYEVFFFQTQGADCSDTCLYLWQQGQYQQIDMAHLHIGLWTQLVDGL